MSDVLIDIPDWLARARRRLWIRRALPPIVAAATVAGFAAYAIGTGPGPESIRWALSALAAGLCLMAGILIAGRLRPTFAETARAADAELGLRERLTTAVELIERGSDRPIAGDQLAQTARLLGQIDPRIAVPVDQTVRRVAAGLAGTLAIGGLVLFFAVGGTPRAPLPLTRGDEAGFDDFAGAELDYGPPAPETGSADPATNEAAARLAETRRQQEAIDRLSSALGSTAAAADVAEALRAGDINRAASRLEDLAREHDQISPRAREQLARALRAAADDPASGPLAGAERAAASALEGRDFRQGQQRLEELARALRQNGQNQASPEEVARAAGVGAAPDGPPPPGQPGQTIPNVPGGQPAAGNVPGSGWPGSGAGTTPGEFKPGESDTRLGVDGIPVELDPGQPAGEGTGRPADPNAGPPVRVRLGAVVAAGASAGGATSTDPVTTIDFDRSVPVDARAIVRDYFTPPPERSPDRTGDREERR